MTDEECSPLPILRLDGACISCWKMDWRERLRVLLTGKVWLGILSGMTQYPCYVTIDQPFRIGEVMKILKQGKRYRGKRDCGCE